jgi:hypothetical protein
MKKKWQKPILMWVVTIQGEPVAGTLAYTRARAIFHFLDGESRERWDNYRDAGYAVARCNVAHASGD